MFYMHFIHQKKKKQFILSVKTEYHNLLLSTHLSLSEKYMPDKYANSSQM